MGIWIMKQDRKGIAMPSELNIFRRGKGYAIATERGTDLGIYSTEEKAMHVIDMINKEILEPIIKSNISDNEIAIYNEKGFEMPKDNEVTQ